MNKKENYNILNYNDIEIKVGFGKIKKKLFIFH